jgi:hypothetical protein
MYLRRVCLVRLSKCDGKTIEKLAVLINQATINLSRGKTLMWYFVEVNESVKKLLQNIRNMFIIAP